MTAQLIEKKHLTASKFAIAKECEVIGAEYRFAVQGLEFIGLPGVLAPTLSPSTSVWRGVPVVKGERFLEIGCGTGVFTVLAALAGASRVTAVDINPSAVANTIANCRLHGVGEMVEVYQSDIFGNVPTGSAYDVILWNIPWSHTEKSNLSVLEQATFDPGLVLLERYLSESPPYLAEGGKLFVGYSSTFGDVERFAQLTAKYSWNARVLYRAGGEDTFFAELFELKRVEAKITGASL